MAIKTCTVTLSPLWAPAGSGPIAVADRTARMMQPVPKSRAVPPSQPKRLPEPLYKRLPAQKRQRDCKMEALEAEVESLKDAQQLQKLQFDSMRILMTQHQQQNHNSVTQSQNLQQQLQEQKKKHEELVQQLQQQKQEAIEEKKQHQKRQRTLRNELTQDFLHELDMAKARTGVGSSSTSSTPSQRAKGEPRRHSKQ